MLDYSKAKSLYVTIRQGRENLNLFSLSDVIITQPPAPQHSARAPIVRLWLTIDKGRVQLKRTKGDTLTLGDGQSYLALESAERFGPKT